MSKLMLLIVEEERSGSFASNRKAFLGEKVLFGALKNYIPINEMCRKDDLGFSGNVNLSLINLYKEAEKYKYIIKSRLWPKGKIVEKETIEYQAK